MQNSFQTSFIPKRSVNFTQEEKSKSKSVFTILSTILLIIMVISSIGFFFYKNYLNKQKESLSASLLIARDSFEKDTISQLELFDKRINITKDILNGHIILSPMFKLLGNLTIPSIQYTKFEHRTENDGFHVNLSGISSDYRSIALQADVFNTTKSRYFKNVIFSNLTKDKKNYVTFDVSFTVDPTLLSYEKNITMKDAKTGPTELQGNLNNN